MGESSHGAGGRKVQCSYCEEWLPGDEAISPEGDEYVVMFCGLECHAAWRAERAGELERQFDSHSGVHGHGPAPSASGEAKQDGTPEQGAGAGSHPSDRGEGS